MSACPISYSPAANSTNNLEPEADGFDNNNPEEFYFTLFYRPGWVFSRREEMQYKGDMIWSVTGILSLNLEKLKDNARKCDISDTKIAIPLPEMEKLNSRSQYNVKNATGKLLEIAPNEASAYMALNIVNGCIARARKIGTLEAGVTLSEDMAELMFTEFREYACPQKENYRDLLKAKIVKRGLTDEWNKLFFNVPGFVSLIDFFAHYWLPVITIDIDNADFGALRFSFSETHKATVPGNSRKLRARKEERATSKIGNGESNYLKLGMPFHFTLKRIGAAENEFFTIHAPDLTLFAPYDQTSADDKPMKFKVLDSNFASSRDIDGTHTIEAYGRMTEKSLDIRTNMRWDVDHNKPYRRLALPYSAQDSTQAEFVKSRYSVAARWRAEPGRRGDAYRYFLLTSLIALLIIGILVLFETIDNGPLSLGQFLSAAISFAPFLVILFSNIQETTTFYREILLRKPKNWIKAGMWCDAIAFLAVIITPALPYLSVYLMRLIILIIIGCCLLVVGIQWIKIEIWRQWNYGINCKNKQWTNEEPVVFKVEIAPTPGSNL